MSVATLAAFGALAIGPSLGFVLGALLSRERGYRIGVAEERARLAPLLEEARDCVKQDAAEIDYLTQRVADLEDRTS